MLFGLFKCSIQSHPWGDQMVNGFSIQYYQQLVFLSLSPYFQCTLQSFLALCETCEIVSCQRFRCEVMMMMMSLSRKQGIAFNWHFGIPGGIIRPFASDPTTQTPFITIVIAIIITISHYLHYLQESPQAPITPPVMMMLNMKFGWDLDEDTSLFL